MLLGFPGLSSGMFLKESCLSEIVFVVVTDSTINEKTVRSFSVLMDTKWPGGSETLMCRKKKNIYMCNSSASRDLLGGMQCTKGGN